MIFPFAEELGSIPRMTVKQSEEATDMEPDFRAEYLPDGYTDKNLAVGCM